MCSDNVFWGSFLGVFQKRTPTHLDVWAIHYTTILSLINGILSRTKFRLSTTLAHLHPAK